MKLITSAVNNFPDTKGDLIKTNENGSKIFSLKGIESMKATDQYIEIGKDGSSKYVATWSGSAAKVVTAFKAFYGLAGDDYVIEQDKAASVDNKRVYYLTAAGFKMARFIADGKTNNGELTISLF